MAHGEAEIKSTLKAKQLTVWRGSRTITPLPNLDEGESACIRIALARREAVLLLIDERAGRAVAQEHGIAVAGTAAVIGMAKQRGLIRSAKASFATLHASDFRISAEVIRTVLARVGEA